MTSCRNQSSNPETTEIQDNNGLDSRFPLVAVDVDSLAAAFQTRISDCVESIRSVAKIDSHDGKFDAHLHLSNTGQQVTIKAVKVNETSAFRGVTVQARMQIETCLQNAIVSTRVPSAMSTPYEMTVNYHICTQPVRP